MATIFYPLASLEQIEKSPSREDGLPAELEEDLRAYGCKLIHHAGILLRQKQVAIATAQILFQRFWFVTSMRQFGVGDIGMGALYLSSKLEECPLRMRDIINVYDLLLQKAAHSLGSKASQPFQYHPMSYFGDTFYHFKEALVVAEMQILKRLGFNVHVTLPYNTLISYIKLIGLGDNSALCTKAWGYLNDGLQTPIYALYQIPTIACAAIFLSARFLKVALPEKPPTCWWELFDAEWEDIWSVCGYIMRLYRPRTADEDQRVVGMLTKKDIRQWLDDHSSNSRLL
ncbi:cyclin-L1 [Coprinopsis sp. MPI-PUGE-AT-0042]|nr:cyclin-L1 [Coprinopsis sp. MPI-PUGE-AT-0042]